MLRMFSARRYNDQHYMQNMGVLDFIFYRFVMKSPWAFTQSIGVLLLLIALISFAMGGSGPSNFTVLGLFSLLFLSKARYIRRFYTQYGRDFMQDPNAGLIQDPVSARIRVAAFLSVVAMVLYFVFWGWVSDSLGLLPEAQFLILLHVAYVCSRLAFQGAQSSVKFGYVAMLQRNQITDRVEIESAWLANPLNKAISSSRYLLIVFGWLGGIGLISYLQGAWSINHWHESSLAFTSQLLYSLDIWIDSPQAQGTFSLWALNQFYGWLLTASQWSLPFH